MRRVLAFVLAMSFPTLLQAQNDATQDKPVPLNPTTAADTAAIKKRIAVHSEIGTTSPWHSARDSLFYTKYNKYGDLKDDDPAFNPRKPWWQVALKVTGSNVFTTSVDRYVLKYEYANVGFRSWRHNLKTGWEWDTDRFGMNFFFHPYSGASYCNSALSSGYNFYQSIPFAIGGSLMYEYFGENSLPSINDVINTPISGVFIGSVLYRLSSNVLDDRATGSNRFFRELMAALLDPSRAFGRLTTGRFWRHTTKEIYQKEPLNVTLSSGVRKLNNGSHLGTGSASTTFNVNLDYGNPFEKRSRKPFDYFKMRTDFNLGAGRKILDNINGLGILTGNNSQHGSLEVLTGLFQHYDFWDNRTFELGAITLGGGVVSKLPLRRSTHLYTSIHAGFVPLAGNSTRYGPDTTQVRDYNYGSGLGGKGEATLDLGRRASATLTAYYYWIHTYAGHKGDHYMAILRPRLEVAVYKELSLGFEHFVYYSDRYPADVPAIHLVRTEQRVFLKMYFEQFKRKG